MELFERVRKISSQIAGSQTRLAVKLGLPQNTFQGYLKIERQDNLWPLLPKILIEYPQVSRDWLYFGEGEMLAEDQAALATPHVDEELLTQIIELLEEALAANKRTLPPKAKAVVICQLYELVLESEEEERKKPIAMLRLINGALAKAGK